MSKGLSFILGIVTGVLLTLGFFVIKNYTAKQDGVNGETTEKQAQLPDGVTMLNEPIPFTEAKNFKILQVVFEDAALAQSEKRLEYTNLTHYTDPVVLILADQKNSFYDDQIIKTPVDCEVMQVGTYNYQTQMGWKTVPIVRFVKAR
ncbi:MAG: hypothetical protein IJV01_06900 [Bacteroidales bacterium]|nr:hypothetical protein [Bacteroidales bacterium]